MGLRWQAKVLDLDFVGKPLIKFNSNLSGEVTESEQHGGAMDLAAVR